MLDIILTSLVVVAAAAYVLWTEILPVRARTMLRAAMTGKPAPCAPDADTHGCASSCPGCGLAKPAVRK